jgi:Anti-sigma factor NepR
MSSRGFKGDLRGKMTRSQDPRTRSSLDPTQVTELGRALGRALQAHFDELLRAPLPPRFEALLAELERQEHTRKTWGNAGR